MPHTAIYARLQASTAVTALTGAGAAARIHQEELPQGARVAVVGESIVIETPTIAHGHDLDGPNQLQEAIVRVTCLAPTLDKAVALAKAARAACENLAVDGVSFNTLLMEVESEDGVAQYPDQGAEPVVFGRALTVSVVGSSVV